MRLPMASLRAWASAGPYPGRLLSPRTEKTTVTKDRFGDVVETRAVSDPVAGETVETKVIDRRTRSLSPRGPRIIFDDLLDPRRRVLREDFLLDDLRVKTFNDRLSAGLNARSLYLDDPQWRRPKTHVDERTHFYGYYGDGYYGALADPLYRRSRIDSLYDPLLDYRVAADYRFADPLYNDHLYRRTAYALDDPLRRRSAYLMNDPLYRSLR